ncbi:hypothetical protein BZA77DRAFT_314145 [Pyronema omphalodes]|nr:hypothetical protein BZA77DRAFT_314145 [Pyronema omphalodes]
MVERWKEGGRWGGGEVVGGGGGGQLSVCLSICLSVCLSVWCLSEATNERSVPSSLDRSACLTVLVFLSLSLSVSLFLFPSLKYSPCALDDMCILLTTAAAALYVCASAGLLTLLSLLSIFSFRHRVSIRTGWDVT